MCCFNLHQPVEGMNYIDAALTMEPTFRGAILQKGMLHSELNEIEEAERLFKKVLDISPDDEQCEILYNIANCYFYLHKYPETITWCERIIQEYPEDQMEALHLMACSHFNMSDLESCLKCMAQIWTLNGFQFANDYSIDKRFKQMFLEIDKIIHQKNNQEESF